MKLNVRSESDAMPKSPSIMETSSVSTHLLSAGTQTEAPQRSNVLFYVMVVLLAISLPLGLPVLVTKAVRLFEMEPQGSLREPSLRGVSNMTAKVRKEDWSRWAVIRHGRLYISETFENRLNEYAEQLYTHLSDRFQGCGKDADIGFSLNRGGVLKGWVEVSMKCGYGTCIRRGEVNDIRGLVIEKREDGHFISNGGRIWGPLRGPVKVGLDDGSLLGLRRVCDGRVEVVFVDVAVVRSAVGDVHVFRFDAREGRVMS